MEVMVEEDQDGCESSQVVDDFQSPQPQLTCLTNIREELVLKERFVKEETEEMKTVQEVKLYNCECCDYTSNDQGNFKRHLQTHNMALGKGTGETWCQLCDFTTSSRKGMIDHIASNHQEVEVAGLSVQHDCKSCDFRGTSRRQLRKHKRQTHPSLLQMKQCSQCDFISPWADSLRIHLQHHALPSSWPQLDCHHCSFFYRYDELDPKAKRRSQQLMNQHMNDDHEALKLPCDQCAKTFWTQPQLETHAKSHSYEQVGPLISCSSCSYTCTKSHRLTNHINAVHLGIRPFHCDQCTSSFPTTSGLKMHILSHTGERQFQCNYCGKGLNTKQSLASHIRTHTGEKPFTCDFCGKSFSDQAYFTRHKRLHLKDETGKQLKEFTCHVCCKGFTRAVYLRSHMKGHEKGSLGRSRMYDNKFKMEAVQRSQEVGLASAAEELCVKEHTLRGWCLVASQPHLCPVCSKGFPYEAQLKKHMETHSGDTSADASPVLKLDPSTGEQRPVVSNIRHSTALKEEVVNWAMEHGVREAADHYTIPLSTVKSWISKLHSPSSCEVCGKSYSNHSTLRRHMEQVHHISSVGEEEGGVSKTFTEYLRDRSLLPSEEEAQRRREEKEQEKRKKEQMVQEAISKEKQMMKYAVEQVIEKCEGDIEKTELWLKTETNPTQNHEVTELSEENFKLEVGPDPDEDDLIKDWVDDNEESDRDDGHDFEDSHTVSEELKSPDLKEESKDEVKDEMQYEVKMELEEEEGEKQTIKRTNSAIYQKEWRAKREGDIPCEWCGVSFGTIAKLLEHQTRRHPTELGDRLGTPVVRHNCPHCQKSFTVRKDFDRHMKQSHGPKGWGKPVQHVVCDICGFKTTRKVYLRRHRTREHGTGEVKMTDYPCIHCGKIFNQMGNWQRHVAAMHEGARLQCDQCPMLFKDKRALVHHSWTHGAPQFPCSQCDLAFRMPVSLENHIKVEHEKGESILRCDQCDKEFATKGTLRIHKNHFHETGGPSAYPCHLCDKILKTAKLLKIHLKRHTDSFPCDECGNTYKSQASLRAHSSAVHKMDLHFSCDTCGKTFNRLTTMTQHQKIHSCAKPFQCVHCSLAYGGKRSMVSHIEKVHPSLARQFRKKELGVEDIMVTF